MIVDLERNDLSRVCEPGSVRWPELMAERELAGVTHLVSTVEGRCARTSALAELLAATFPGGSVTGAPKIAARRPDRRARAGRPRRLDGRARRRARNGDFDLALTIRTFAIADGPDAPLGRRRHRLGLRAGGRDRGVVDEGAAAARRGRRAGRGGDARMRLLAVAVAGRGVVDPAEPVLRADDEALLRGRAAFETIRVYGGAPFRLAEHLERLAALGGALGLPPVNRLELEELAAAGARGRGRAGRRAAPLLDADADRALALVSRARRPSRRRCARGASGSSRSAARAPTSPWLLPGVKSTSYAVNMAAEAEAKRRGADDAVFVARTAIVLEAPTTNIWWRRGRTLFTPVARARRAGRRHAGGAARARAGGGYGVEEGAFAARRAGRRRRGFHVVVGPRGDAGRRARRRPIGRGPGRRTSCRARSGARPTATLATMT